MTRGPDAGQAGRAAGGGACDASSAAGHEGVAASGFAASGPAVSGPAASGAEPSSSESSGPGAPGIGPEGVGRSDPDPSNVRAPGSAAADTREHGVVARGLVKRFGSAVALRGVSFTLPARGVVGLLGPNGAGKTTTIRMIAGVHLPDEGELTVCGLDARLDGARVRGLVGYLPESAPLYPELTVREALAFRAGLAGLRASAARGAIDDAMERTDVARFSQRCCGALSKGMQQRVGLAAAILADPRVLILDEPSVGLDPEQVLAFRELVRSLGATRLVLFSSHLLSEVECLASELLVIAYGRVAAHESLASFRARARPAATVGQARGDGRGGDRAEAAIDAVGDASFGTSFDTILETSAPLPPLGEVDARFESREVERLSDGWTRTTLRAAGGDANAAREALARALFSRGIVARTIRGAEARPESARRVVHPVPDRAADLADGGGSGGLERVFVELVRAAAREGGADR